MFLLVIGLKEQNNFSDMLSQHLEIAEGLDVLCISELHEEDKTI